MICAQVIPDPAGLDGVRVGEAKNPGPSMSDLPEEILTRIGREIGFIEEFYVWTALRQTSRKWRIVTRHRYKIYKSADPLNLNMFLHWPNGLYRSPPKDAKSAVGLRLR